MDDNTKFDLYFYSRTDAIELVVRDLDYYEAFRVAQNVSDCGIWIADKRHNITARSIEEERERAQNATWGTPYLGMTRTKLIKDAVSEYGTIERINPSRVEWRISEDE